MPHTHLTFELRLLLYFNDISQFTKITEVNLSVFLPTYCFMKISNSLSTNTDKLTSVILVYKALH